MTEDTSPENLRKFLKSDDPDWTKFIKFGKPAIEPLCDYITSIDYSQLYYDLPPVIALKEIRDARNLSEKEHEKIDKVLDAVVKGLVKLLYNEDLYESDETSSLDPGYQPWQLFFWRYCHRILTDLGEIGGLSALKALEDFTELSLVADRKKIHIVFGPEWDDCSYDTWNAISDARKTATANLTVESLIKALEDKDEDVVPFAAQALGTIGDVRAVEPLIEALKDDEVRKGAAEALRKISEVAVEPLINGLATSGEDADILVYILGRWWAARAGLAAVIGALKEACEGGDGDACLELDELLEGSARDRAVQLLIEALGDGEWYVRWYAAMALGEIGDARAVEPLIELLGDESEYIRKYAADALKKLGHEVE